MLKAARRFKLLALSLILAVAAPASSYAGESQAAAFEPKKKESSLSRDIFEQGIYYVGIEYLHFDRLYRAIFRKKTRAKDVNIYDEVPDSAFFTNRHGRKPLTAQQLKDGYRENKGPDLSKLEIMSGKFGEFNNRVVVVDGQGAKYLLKFDHAEALGLATSAEMIANRFYYAIGFNVPQDDLIAVDASQLKIKEGAEVFDGTGFKKPLTLEKLQEYLIFMPQTEDGKYILVASKIIEGISTGASGYQGKRNHPDDPYSHETRRELRAFPIFASWMNHVDVRNQNTIQFLQQQDGRTVLKHFLVDTDSALGADPHGVKPANFGHVYMLDYWDTFKGVFQLGLVERPWQKRWREYGEAKSADAATTVGYFDNHYFDPGKFKVWLQSYAYKDMTLADAFWAAKIIMSFSDQDVAEIVKVASFTSPENQDLLTKTLTERRDMIGKYWFAKSAPLDSIDVKDGKLVFEDLAVRYGFEKAEGTVYHVDVFAKSGKKKRQITSFTSNEASVSLDPSWGQSAETVILKIRVTRNGSKPGPYVKVKLENGKITRIAHQD